MNIAGIAIVLQMRERMEEMNRQMQGFVDYVRTEMLARMQQQQPQSGTGADAAACDGCAESGGGRVPGNSGEGCDAEGRGCEREDPGKTAKGK